MFISQYSLLMALLWFTIAALIGSYMLRRVEKYSLFLVSAIFLLALLRGVLPLDFYRSIVVRSRILYPMLLDFAAFPVYGGVTIGQCLLALWGGGAVFKLVLLLSKLVRHVRRLHRASNQVSNPAFALLFREVCDELGYRGKLKVSIMPGVSTAYQAGFLHPHIILPAEVYGLEDRDICNMLRHELCHYLGRDLWIKIGMKIAACFLWWNPAMSLLNRSVEQLLELYCDRRACRVLSEDGQLEYLSTLLYFVRSAPARTSDMSLSYLGNVKEAGVQQRFLLMLQDKPSKRSRFQFLAGCAVCIVLFVASYCVVLQPHELPSILSEPGSNAYVDSDSNRNFILQLPDGTYAFYQDNRLCGLLSEGDTQREPYRNLPIYSTGETS